MELNTSVDDQPSADQPSADQPNAANPPDPADQPSADAAGRPTADRIRQPPWAGIGAVLGVLVPLALMVRFAVSTGPSFDGAMNLQVADNISNGLGYVRNYGGTVEFPGEIQTSGPYIFLAAGLISVFGAGTFVFQLPNLIFATVLLAAVSFGLRPWPVLRTIGPFTVLFAVPGMAENAMKGYGEYVIASLIFAAFVLVGAATSGRRPILLASLAWVLVGTAVTVKVIAVLAAPVLAVGLIGVAIARPAVSRWRLTASSLFVAIPVALIELHRLISLGVSPYLTYWSELLSHIGAQAGVNGADFIAQDAPTSLTQKVADHVHLLSVATGISPYLLLLEICLPFVILVGLFLTRQVPWQRWLALPGALLAVMLASYAGGYLIWWMAITPTSKAWLRRLIIALVAIAFLSLLLAGMARERWRGRPAVAANTTGSWLVRTGWVVVAVLAVICLLPAVTTAGKQVRTMASANSSTVSSAAQLAQTASTLAAGGNTLYGTGWWSAPVVALYAHLPLGDLQTVSACDPATGIPAGKAYLVWDFYAAALASKAPQSERYDFVEVPGTQNNYGTIWQITPKPEVHCPTG